MDKTTSNQLPPFPGIIHAIDEIRADIGEAHPHVQKKVISIIDEHARSFIAKSPLFFFSTSNANGSSDVSPRGDAAGFVRVLDERRFIFPERLGNRRLDSMQNLLTNPEVGLLFIIPGVEMVLRVNGRAWLTKDEELLATMQLNGRSPVAAVGVEVQECFVHCSRALKLSKIWESETWIPEQEQPDGMDMFRAHVALNGISLED